MPPKLQQIRENLDSAIRKAEYAKSFAEIMKIFVAMKEANQKERADLMALVKEKIATIDSQYANHESRIYSEMKSTEREMMDYCMKEMDKMGKDQRNDLNFIRDKVREYKKDCENEHGQMMADMKKMLPEMPESFNPTPIENEINRLKKENEEQQKEIDELKKRPVGGVGGVTNLRIQQAFKYILKTEQPTGDIDGANLTYTLSQPIFAILSMSLNGETIAQLPNYTINGNTFTFTTALPAAYANKDFEVKFI